MLCQEKVLCPAAEALQTCMILIIFLIAQMLQPLCRPRHAWKCELKDWNSEIPNFYFNSTIIWKNQLVISKKGC